jgi:hypothetical protein
MPVNTRAGALAGVGQRRRLVPGHRPDGDALPGQVRGEGVADLAGAEHDAGRSSLMSRSSLTPSSRAVGDSGTSMPAATLCRTYKTSNRFLEIFNQT